MGAIASSGAPDPIDGLLASRGRPDVAGMMPPRVLDFVRTKFRKLKEENKALQERVTDLEHTLSIVQTAQTWSQGNMMSPEQAAKVQEVTALLQQAKLARQEAMNFSKVGKGVLYEKLRSCKNALRRERQEKREMKERLVHAFEHARIIKEQNDRMKEKVRRERDGWQQLIRDIKEKQRAEIQRLKDELGTQHGAKMDRMRQLSQFGERVMKELGALQEHLTEVRQETVDNVLPGEDDDDDLLDFGSPLERSRDMTTRSAEGSPPPPGSAPADVGRKQGLGTQLPPLNPDSSGSGGFFITQQ